MQYTVQYYWQHNGISIVIDSNINSNNNIFGGEQQQHRILVQLLLLLLYYSLTGSDVLLFIHDLI